MATHRVFFYGTLKRGQPNHDQVVGAEKGTAEFIGLARTVQKWPLVIASSYNIPYILDREGIGNQIEGELYLVDDKMLAHCDKFESNPVYYQRTTFEVKLYEDSLGSQVKDSKVETVMMYILRGFKDFLLELPMLVSYDSEGDHGLHYMRMQGRTKEVDHRAEVLKLDGSEQQQYN